MISRHPITVSMDQYTKAAGFGIGDKVWFRATNCNDNAWQHCLVKEIWGINIRGYSNPSSLTVNIEFDGAPCCVNTAVLVQAQREYVQEHTVCEQI